MKENLIPIAIGCILTFFGLLNVFLYNEAISYVFILIGIYALIDGVYKNKNYYKT